MLHEITKEYSDLISDSIKKAQDSWTTLQRNTMSKLIDCFPQERDAEVKAFQKQLLNPGVGFEGTISHRLFSSADTCGLLCLT